MRVLFKKTWLLNSLIALDGDCKLSTVEISALREILNSKDH
jgi:hypothetical protein